MFAATAFIHESPLSLIIAVRKGGGGNSLGFEISLWSELPQNVEECGRNSVIFQGWTSVFNTERFTRRQK